MNISARLAPFEHIQKCFRNANSNLETLSWDQFNCDQKQNAGRKVILKQKDFKNGTVRIRESCWLVLGEDILFNPNRGFGYKTASELKGLSRGNNWLPTKKQLKNDYDLHAYRLGFFAALAIETKNVWVDLNGYTLEQSPEHRLMQRFFAIIELADQPFLPLTGPSNFGDVLDSASEVIVSNGTIGLSSHHGVHGNNNINILFQSLVFRDYEVAAISLNGSKDVVLDQVKLLGNDIKVPVLGTFSSLRFLDQFAIRVKGELEEKIDLSRLVQQQIYYSVIKGGRKLKCISGSIYKQIMCEFINSDGLVDGNVYGLLFNKPSVAVNAFTESVDEYVSKNISLNDVQIDNTICKVREIVVLNRRVKGELKPVVDTAGSILQIDKIVDKDGRYKYSILSDYKITLSEAVHNLDAEHQKHFGTLYIPKELYHWIRSDLSINKFIKYGHKDGQYVRTRNSDTMNHVNKGVNAIRIDGVENIYLYNVGITNTINKGESGIDDIVYYGSKDGGHVKQSGNEPNKGYMGADTRAIGLFSVKNFKLEAIGVDHVTSYNGKSIGIDLQGSSDGFYNKLDHVSVNDIVSDTFACGIRVGPHISVNLNLTDVDSGNFDPKSTSYIIDNNNVSITNEPYGTQKINPWGDLLWGLFIIFLLVIVFYVLYTLYQNMQKNEYDLNKL